MIGYGYDADDDVTSMTTSGLAAPGGAGTVTNSYGYDEAGRLTSWTAAPATGAPTTAAYGYDNDGNLVSAGGATYTYDARDEQISDGNGNSYSYTANGDLDTQTSSGGAEVSSIRCLRPADHRQLGIVLRLGRDGPHAQCRELGRDVGSRPDL